MKLLPIQKAGIAYLTVVFLILPVLFVATRGRRLDEGDTRFGLAYAAVALSLAMLLKATVSFLAGDDDSNKDV